MDRCANKWTDLLINGPTMWQVYDVDEPQMPVEVEDVQRILHTLDMLDAANDPKNSLYGTAPGVLATLAGNRTCRRYRKP